MYYFIVVGFFFCFERLLLFLRFKGYLFLCGCSQAQQGNSSKKSEKKNVKRSNEEDNNAKDFIEPETPRGEKKRMSAQMAKQYNPSAVEKSCVRFLLYIFFLAYLPSALLCFLHIHIIYAF